MADWLDNVEECVERTLSEVGPHLIMAAPLGLGKPVQLMNAFYRRVAADSSLSLHVYTALTLETPDPAPGVEANLSGPIIERLFGDYESLDFSKALMRNALPSNITVSEFYFRAGSMKGVSAAQQAYLSSNYTHVARDLAAAGINVVVQLLAQRQDADGARSLSLSCNPDVSLELMRRLSATGRRVMRLGQVHADLPFMTRDAQLDEAAFDLVVDHRRYDRTLFAVPNEAVTDRDYALALHASALIEDGGTLQIGIGALGDAVAQACIVRHEHNDLYVDALRALSYQSGRSHRPERSAPCSFSEGLYVSTEMFVNGMQHLIEHDIVKRRVYDNLILQQGLNEGLIEDTVDDRMYDYARATDLLPRVLSPATVNVAQSFGLLPPELEVRDDELRLSGNSFVNDLDQPETREAVLSSTRGRPLQGGAILHGGFYLGPADFYQKLRDLPAEQRDLICMTGVERTNQLLLDVPLYTAQRRKARFINTGMMVSLSGAVTSDALEDGTVISGVGGQYNFVAMAHELPDARSILCIRSTRGSGRSLASNIVPSYGHTTIPKHLRDIVVTEYGVADLRGQSDAEIVRRLLNVTDTRFQDELLAVAINNGKLPEDYRVPEFARHNTPQHITGCLASLQRAAQIPDYPFGTDLTEREIALATSLRSIQALSDDPLQLFATALRALLHREDEDAARPFLERVQLEHPDTPRDFLLQQMLLLDLEQKGLLKVR
ncbi:MAG: acetyl-CoA hydrolase/transferase C-terminal domain-containing protein [Pseudomonadota bacterium]